MRSGFDDSEPSLHSVSSGKHHHDSSYKGKHRMHDSNPGDMDATSALADPTALSGRGTSAKAGKGGAAGEAASQATGATGQAAGAGGQTAGAAGQAASASGGAGGARVPPGCKNRPDWSAGCSPGSARP